MLTPLHSSCDEARAVRNARGQDVLRFDPGLQGVWANEATLEACRQELQDGLEDWLLLGASFGHELSVVDGIELEYSEAA